MPAALRELTDGRGVDHVFECVGAIPVIAQASECMTIRGTLTIVGVPPTGSRLEIPWSAIRPECRVQTSRMGSNRFRQDIPAYLEFYRQGRLNLDDLITRRGRLEQINEAFGAMKDGEVARTVLMFD
jgi:S-(hydroxymethyl)glutathione dehydrogenase/alcohol dehydrogenase